MNQSLSIPQLAQGMLVIRRNASELLQEAAILGNSFNGARGFALTYTSCEELAKYFVLEGTGRRLQLGHTIDWKKFWRRFRSHDSKIAQAEVRLILSAPKDDRNTSPLHGFSLTIRNGSLYGDLSPDGSFRAPSDIEWQTPTIYLRAQAEALLVNAGRAGTSVEEIEDHLRLPPSAAGKEDAIRLFLIVIERARSQGKSIEEVRSMIDKSFGLQ